MRVLITGNRPQDRDQCRRAALRIGLECTSADCVTLADARHRLTREPPIQMVVVVVDADTDAAAQTVGYAARHTRRPIYAVTATEDPDTRGLVEQAGAAQVWPLNRVREELLNAAEEIRKDGAADYRRGRVIAVASAQAGAGVTTVATGLAFGLVAKNESVVLAELGNGIPELALDLDVAPAHSLADLIKESDRLDVSMIQHAVTPHPAGVDVLAYAAETLVPEQLPPAAARDFLMLLRSLYDWVVIDVGHSMAGGNAALIRHADGAAVVTRLDAPGLRLTRRFIKALNEDGLPADHIGLVANRYGQAGLVHWKTARDTTPLPFRAWLPDDPRGVNKALTNGKPLAKSSRLSRLNREFYSLAADYKKRLTAAKR